MTHPAPTRPTLPRLGFAAGLLLACLAASAPADVVILKDGFVIQGTIRKETAETVDKASGQVFQVPKATGFDSIDEGPKVLIFSSHSKQLGAIEKDVKLRPEYRAFTLSLPGRKSNHPAPAAGTSENPPDFDAKWHRTLKVQVPGGFDLIEQQVTYLDPYFCYVVSPTHLWRQTYRTSEMDPQKVRKLLSTHPDLAEPDGKPDPLKRVAVARFLKDVGWLQLAQDEVARLRKDCPMPLAKEAQAEFDKLLKEMDVAVGELVATEAEFALAGGRYQYAADLLAAFPDKTADAKDLDRATRAMAQLKTAREQYETGRRLLSAQIDEVTGDHRLRAAAAAGGAAAVLAWPRKELQDTRTLALAAAARVVSAELHPDSAGRLELFVNLAAQAEREKAQGAQPTKKTDELLATAVSGWAKGKNGATPSQDAALRVWTARQVVLAVQRAADRNARNDVLGPYKRGNPLPLDELTQVIALLPPAEPEDLAARTGTPVPSDKAPEGTYRRKTPPTFDHPAGMDYLVKLPPEYHHGRAYPVLLAMTAPNWDPEQMMKALATETDRHGYILVAPAWTGQFGPRGWDYRGEDHDWVTGVLRDVIRHFTVDNDRVFLFGVAQGANAAMDVGVSHPDLFAGVLCMGPVPKWQGLMRQYWPNAQKLPFYIVTGEQAPFQELRLTFGEWMPKGFPAVMGVYKGRGLEWFAAEVPVMFDWMSRKRRPSPTATLALGGTNYEWQTMRQGDNRFFWLGSDRIGEQHDSALKPVNVPAGLKGDLRGNNLIYVSSRGVRTVTIWLNREMIDWEKPVKVFLNGTLVPGWKQTGKKIDPDIDVLLEDYRERGDRRMLFLNKLEFAGRN